MEQNQQYLLGPWVICPMSNSLTDKVSTRSLDNKSMQVLIFLIQHAGENVTKRQIFEHVWKGNVVAEDILSVTINKIRKALGDNARSPSFIKTLPSVGYSLIAKVQKIDRPEQTSRHVLTHKQIYLSIIALLVIIAFYFTVYSEKPVEDSTANLVNINSIAVLPFDNRNSADGNHYFVDGLSDAIINQLSQMKQLKVISRYSSFTYRGKYDAKEIGKALQVDALLDGSVQMMGKQVRINVRIVSTKNGRQLWSKTFDNEVDNYFKLQDRISATVHRVIQPGLSPYIEPIKPINSQAYEWYLMGQYHWRQRNPKSLTKAVTYFKQSLDLEPNYAEAHLGLGITYALLHQFSNWSEQKAASKALPHIEKTLELKPNSPTALAAKGLVLTLKANDEIGIISAESAIVQQAQHAFLRSLELDDNATTHNWYSILLKLLGQEKQVIHHMNKAIELNPLSAPLKRSSSLSLQSIGKQNSAQRLYQRAEILEPNHLSHITDSTHVFRHSQNSIIAMANWQATNPELFTTCSSDEYCEQVVLAYLSIGANEAANDILDRMKSKHGHFISSLELINHSLNGEDHTILARMQRLASHRPNNQKALFNLAIAQFKLEQFKQAQNTLLQLNPKWEEYGSLTLDQITADNYPRLVLYASTLSKLDEKDAADILLNKIKIFLQQDKVFDKVQVEFTLSEINAQLNNKPKALQHLTTALEMGWLPYYDKEWWQLQSNHLLQPIYQEPSFKLLLQEHHENLHDLREIVARKLKTTSHLIQ